MADTHIFMEWYLKFLIIFWQILHVMDYVNKDPDDIMKSIAMILCGDLNTKPDSYLLELFFS